ncbi:UDP-glucose 4-epimerase [Candidatus Hydrogenisulfobacillus filiaventi]|uniref:UDP-glucose 4-epimerase n=1 Tax=Candidatus Hydrogenisulfobacillus filiaventi TaxID=2707344 RepID=A0A6F8ZEF7_9FIRM|nr:NAD-dependent epimerase/dehydratase family protein [Bacillota bacterium]CAB1127842.1 UDP-glucose 4-epimerase [Candidatus Hydrogenisulfobacillus filiaventi]
MRVVVTGGAGFIGSHLVPRLVARGHQVTVVDNLSAGRRERVPEGARLLVADVRLTAAWVPRLPEGADVLIHLAAQASVPLGEAHPREDFAANAEGTLAALEAALTLGVREVRFASSAAVYGDPARLPVPEEAPTVPRSFYGVHKLLGEGLVAHWGERYGMRTVILRLANVYGPGQGVTGEGGVVAVFLDALRRGRLPVLHGDGRQTRDFVAVEDVAAAFLHRLGESPSVRVNVATGIGTSIGELWQQMAALAGVDPARVRRGPARVGDIRHSRLDPERARAWGFAPRIRLEDGLRRLWETAAPAVAAGEEQQL